MFRLRASKVWVSLLAALALVASAVAVGHGHARGSPKGDANAGTFVDSVLGVIILCHQDTADAAGDGAPLPARPASPGDATGKCQLCLLLSTFALLGAAFLLLLAAPLGRTTSRLSDSVTAALNAPWPPGGLGSRAPPVLV